MSDGCYGEFGIVKIIKGPYKGRFGYYDDDDGRAIVYLGDMFDGVDYILINHNYITNDYTVNDLQERSNEIGRTLWIHDNEAEKYQLLAEKTMIDQELLALHEKYLDNKKLEGIKVFLSHSSLDKRKVVTVALDLQERGIDTWLDAYDILPGESIVDKINDGLTNSNFILLFLSKNSVKSNWVKKEWESMLWDEINTGKTKIIPIKLDDCEIPKILQTKKYIDFSYDYNSGLFLLVDALKRYIQK